MQNNDVCQGRPLPPYQVRADSDPAYASQGSESLAFGTRGWTLAIVAFVQAEIWAHVFTLSFPGVPLYLIPSIMPYLHHPGFGFTLFALVALISVLAGRGRGGRWDHVTIPLVVAAGALSLVPSIAAPSFWTAFDVFVLGVVGTLTAYLVCAPADIDWTSPRALIASFAAFFRSLLAYAFVPARAFRCALSGKRNMMRVLLSIACGLLVAAGLATVVLALLVSADEVFASLVQQIHLPTLVRREFLRLVYALLVFPVLFSLLWGFSRAALKRPAPPSESEADFSKWVVGSVAVLVVLDVLYAVFALVQLVYLFGGAESAAMAAGYAEYARSGFFQLVAVTCINVAVVLPAQRIARSSAEFGRRALSSTSRTLTALLVLLTAVILVSAAMRMGLYVAAYGLTPLRVFTFLSMVLIAVCLLALMVRVFRPQTGFWHVVLAAGIVVWAVPNLFNVNAFIANYNVDRAMEGSLPQFDVSELEAYGDDAVPALERYAEFEAGDALAQYELGHTSALDVLAHEKYLRIPAQWTHSSIASLRADAVFESVE